MAGCNASPHCKGCHSEESWDFNAGEEITRLYFSKMWHKIKEFDNLIDKIWILGGDPLDNDIEEIYEMVNTLSLLNKEIWLFTRYSLEEVKVKLKKYIKVFDYIKCGAYEQDLTVDDNIQYGVKLATSNQKIYKRGVDY